METHADIDDYCDGETMMARIREAATRLAGVARRTPVMTSRTLDTRAGGKVFLKCENFQNIGAFKFRGAYNALASLSTQQRTQGVLTFSSGNHGQAVARVGQLLGIPVVVVMPDNAPAGKLAATRGYGAKIVTYDPEKITREEMAAGLPEAGTHTLIPPYDHYDVIAGQGTVALELFEQAGRMERLLVPVGGGGLLAGSSVVAHFASPGCQVIGVEPALADDAARSFRSGRIERTDNPATIADGTRTPSLGHRNFALIRRYTHDIVTVSEEAIYAALAFALGRLKIVVEPSGVLGIAALLFAAVPAGPSTAVLLSGGNIDARTMTAVLAKSSL